MKFKYYLRGCGLGILLTVLVMGISIQTRGGIMTDEKALTRAAELGMVTPADDTETDTEEAETETALDTEDAAESESATEIQ